MTRWYSNVERTSREKLQAPSWTAGQNRSREQEQERQTDRSTMRGRSRSGSQLQISNTLHTDKTSLAPRANTRSRPHTNLVSQVKIHRTLKHQDETPRLALPRFVHPREQKTHGLRAASSLDRPLRIAQHRSRLTAAGPSLHIF